MNVCTKCGVKYNADLNICPVCGNKLDENANTDIFALNSASYPLKKLKNPPLEPIHIYTITALIAVILAGILNAFFFTDLMWSISVALIAVFGGITVLTVTARINFTAKVLYETFSAVIAVYLMTFVFGTIHWFTAYALPIIFMLGTATQFSLMLFTHKRFRLHYVSTSLMALLGAIPLIVAYCMHSNLIASFASVGLSAIVIIVSLSLGGKNLAAELKGRFSA